MTTESIDIIRCFLALYPDETALAQMLSVIDCLRERQLSIRWEKPEHIHITLKFIGSVRRQTMLDVAEVLKAHVPDAGPIDAVISVPGAFPNLRNPRIVWLGFQEKQTRVLDLQQMAESVCAHAGIMREPKSFTPHFTIGRVKEHGKNVNLHKELDPCRFQPIPVRFSALRLMESRLTPEGAIHTELRRVDFSI